MYTVVVVVLVVVVVFIVFIVVLVVAVVVMVAVVVVAFVNVYFVGVVPSALFINLAPQLRLSRKKRKQSPYDRRLFLMHDGMIAC